MYSLLQSARGLAHSRTLTRKSPAWSIRQVLECGGPPPLSLATERGWANAKAQLEIDNQPLYLGRVNKVDKQLDRFLRKAPSLGKDVYIAKGAAVLGDVTLGEGGALVDRQRSLPAQIVGGEVRPNRRLLPPPWH